MASRLRVAEAAALALAMLVGANTAASAHRRDEYLQAARIGIDPGRVELQLDLTPGIEVADKVIADIDRNHDGRLSDDEQRAYVRRVLNAVGVEIDRQSIHIAPIAWTFPDVTAFRQGEGSIRVTAEASQLQVPDGPHQLTFSNAYQPDISVYLANALVPASDRVAIHGQTRDANQRQLAIDYDVAADPLPLMTVWLLFGIVGAMVLGAVALRVLRGVTSGARAAGARVRAASAWRA